MLSVAERRAALSSVLCDLPGFLVMSQWLLQGLFLAGQGLTCVFYATRYANIFETGPEGPELED